MKRIFFLFLVVFLPLSIQAQEDVSVGNLSIVGGDPFCPDSNVSFEVRIDNAGPNPNDITGDIVRILVNGPVATPAFNVTIAAKVGNTIPNGGNQTLTYPDDFNGIALLDFSTPGFYTLTVSITIPGDTDNSNNILSKNNIQVYTPATPTLTDNAIASTICSGDDITFTIQPYSATATYTFYLNGAIEQQLSGVNSITYSSIGANAISDGDVITIGMIDSNGCTTDTSTISTTVTVEAIPSASLTSDPADAYFCDSDLVTFTATGGGTYSWYVDGSLIGGASAATYSTSLNDGQIVTVRVTNAAGCFDEESITVQKLTVSDDGNIVLQNAGDSDLCFGDNPTGAILGDGTGASVVATVSDGTPSYQWQSSTDGVSFSDIVGATSANFTPGALSVTTYFRRNVVVSPSTSECEVDGSDIVVINVRPQFVIGLSTSDPSNSFCQEETVTVSANAGAANYEFFINGASQQNSASETFIIETAATRNLAASPDIVQNGDNITVEVTDSFGCVTSQTIAIIVDEVGLNPGLSTNAPGNIICNGQSVIITASGGTTYDFFINTPGNPALPAEVSGNVFTTTRLNDGDVVTARVYNASGCYIDVDETFEVLELTDAGDIRFTTAADSNICYNDGLAGTLDGDGTVAGSSVAAGTDTIGYQWQSSIDSGVTWNDIAGANSADYAPPGNFTTTTSFRRVAFTWIDSDTDGIFDEDISCGNLSSNVLTVNVGANFDPNLSTGVLNNLYCDGDTVNITAAAGATNYTFTWDGNTVGPAANRVLTRTAGNGAGEIDDGDIVTVTATIGTCTFTEDIVINVDFFGTNPTAQLSSDAPSDTICAGETIVITAGPNQPGYSYTFEINGSPVVASEVVGNVYTTSAITAESTVEVTVTNSSGCSDTETITVLVPLLATAGTVTLNAADAVLCPGDTIANDITVNAVATLDAAASAGSALTYQWQLRNNGTGNLWQDIVGATSDLFDVSATPLNITEDTQIRRLTYASLNTVDCPTNGLPSNVVSIDIEDPRDPTITVNPGTSVCRDDVDGLVFTVNTTNTQATDTYQWYRNGAAIGGATNTTYSPALDTDINDGDTITVIVTTVAPDSCTFTSAGTLINVTPDPVANLTSDATADTICAGDTIIITADPVAGATYTFELNGAPVPAGQVVGNVYTTSAITAESTVEVTVTSAGGCSDTDTITVLVPLLATAGTVTLNAADAVLCPGDTIANDITVNAVATLDAAASAGSALTYQWQLRNTTTGNLWQDIVGATSDLFDVSATPLNITEDTQIRRLTYASLNTVDCPTNGLPSNVVSIDIEDPRDPTITVNPGTSVCRDDVDGLVFTVNTINTQATDTYQWYRNGAAIGGATNTTYSPALDTDINDGDTITVIVTTVAPDSCTSTSAGTVITITPDPVANLTSDATADTICAGDTIIITADPVAGATYTFELNGAPVPAGQVVGNVYTTSAITAESTVEVTVTSAGGCSDTDTITVLVPLLATAGTVTLNAADAVLCPGDTIANDITVNAVATLDAAASAGSALTYQWQLRNNGTGNLWQDIVGATSDLFDVSATPLNITEDTQIRRLTYASLNTVDCPTNGLPSNVVSIDIEDPRDPTITVNPGTSVCRDDVDGLVFTVNTINTQATDTYQWYRNGAAIGGATNTTYSPALDTDINDGDTITVIVTTVAPDSCTFTSAGTLINVTPDPVANLTSDATADTICAGDTIIITADPVAGATYTFELNGAPVPAGQVVGNVYTTSAITAESTVEVTVTSAGGCSDTDTITVLVPLLATAGTVTLNAADAVLCPGDTIANDITVNAVATLDAAASAGSALTYQWQLRNTTTGNLWQDIVGATSDLFDVSATPLNITEDTQIRRLTYASLNTVDCPTNGLPSNVVSIDIEDPRDPTITVNPGTSVCRDDVDGLVFTVNTTNTQATDTYQWYRNGAAIGGATNTTYSPALDTDINDGDTITVIVTTVAPDSCTFTSAGTLINVTPDPVANLTSDATADTICAGDTIIITADPVAGATYTFELNGAPVPAGQVVGNVYTTSAITAESTVEVTVTSAGGCSDTDTITVLVPLLATAGTVTLNAADAVLCPGDTIANDITVNAAATLDAAASAGSALTYQWQLRNTTTGNLWQDIVGATSDLFDVSATPLNITEDTQIRRLTYASLNTVDCPTNGLPSNVVSIDIEDPRDPTITVNPGTSVCRDDVDGLVFTVNTTNTQATDTYQWYRNGAAIGGATNTTYSPALDTDINDGDTITVIVTTVAPDSCTFTSAGTLINVTPDPVANLTSDATADTICAGDTIIITADPVAGATYTFELNGAPVPAGQVVGNVYTTSAITAESTVEVTVTSAGGCSDTDTITVLVPLLATAGTVTLNAADAVLCPGDTIANDITVNAVATLDAAASAGSALTYQWQLRNTTTGNLWQDIVGATSDLFDVSATPLNITEDTQIRRLTYASLNTVDCPTNGLPSNVVSIDVEEDRVPTVTVNPGTSVCRDDVDGLVFTVNTTNTQATDTYQWYRNGAAIGGATNTTYSPALDTDINDGDTITVIVTTVAPDSCTSTSAGTLINVTPDPVANLTSDATADTICAGDTIIITADPVAGATYTFELNGAPVPAGQVVGNVYTTSAITAESTVEVTVTSAGGCSDTDTITVLVPLLATAGTVTLNAADAVLCPGDTIANDITVNAVATLDAAASAGSALTYQWQLRNTTTGNLWQDIVGATSDLFDVSATPLNITEDTQIRRLTYASLNTVDCPTNGLPSNVVSIDVEEDRVPTVTVNPGTSVCRDDVDGLVFTVNTTNTQATDTYQWYRNGAAIGGATNTTYSPALDTDINDGDTITVIVTTVAPDSCTFTSAGTLINVTPDPVANLTSDAVNNIICGGLDALNQPFADTVTFTADPVPGATYQFFMGATAISPVQIANTFSTNDFSIYDTDLEYTITVEVINAAGCVDNDSMVIELNYVTADYIQIDGGGVTENICNGTAPANQFISVGAEDAPDGTDDFADGADYPQGAAITYQWQNRIAGGGWSDITGATARNYTSPVLNQTTEFRRRSRSILNGVSIVPCDNFSNIITINVASALAGGEVQRDTGGGVWVDQTEIICAGDSPQQLRVINDTGGPGVDYQWQYSLDNVTWEDITTANGYAVNAVGATYQPDPINLADIRSIHTLQLTGLMATDGDFYRITVGADSFTVTIGEDNSDDITGGDGDVDTIAEIIEYLTFKINELGAGITASEDGVDTITYTLAPGSTLTPVIRVDDGGADVTGANSTSNQTYNGQGNTRFYRRGITQNFGGAILPLCNTFSDVHTVEVNSVISGSIDNADPVICFNTPPSPFTSVRNGSSTVIGAIISYQWYRTTDNAMLVWAQIPGATNQNLTFTTNLTQSTRFRRETISTVGPDPTECSLDGPTTDDADVTAEFTITVLDDVNPGNILANQTICREDGAPLTIDVADLVPIVATNVETDDGTGDGIIYQWQFSVDNVNWDDIIAGDRNDLLNGGFAATLNTGASITAAQQEADIERRLQTLIDPDIATTVYYRLTTTRFDDVNDNNTLEVGDELECEVISPVTRIEISAQPTIVQISGPANTQTVCAGDPITNIVFEYGGSATGIIVTGQGALNVANDPLNQTVTLSGTPGSSLNISLRTTGTTCEIEFLNYNVTRVQNRPAPDYITIDDAAGGNPPDPIIDNQDANIYDGQQAYLCEPALGTGPANTLFGVCYNDGRVPPANGYLWEIRTPGAGSINPTTGEVDWTDGFFGDAIIRVYAYACDGTTPAAFRETVVTVNEFDSAATQPTEPVPLLEAEIERVTIAPDPARAILAGERYNITLNGVRYTFETTDVVAPINGNADQNAFDIAQALRDLINNDTTSPVAGLFNATAFQFNPGDINGNGLFDDVGGVIDITAQYDGNSAPPIPPGSPRGYDGDMNLIFSVTPAPTEARAFGNMTGFELNETSANICGDLTGAEPWCQTTATTPNTQYFSSASFYTDIRFAIASVVPGPGSVPLPGVIDAATGELNWNAGFHGTFNIESYATGCDGVENPIPGVHNVRIYPNLDPPSDISYDPITLPDCPAIDGETTQFTSSSEVTWSWNNNDAGTLDSVTGLVTWADGWSGTVIITATSFGCGGESLSRTVIVPDSPSLSRISDLTTTNQSLCVGSNIVPIRYEILGSATGANVTGIDDLNLFITPSSENQVDQFTLSDDFADDGDQYILTINQVPYTVATGENNQLLIPAADGDVDTLDEVIELIVLKINNASLGITAVNNGGGIFTLTSNGFDYSVTPSLNDVAGNENAVTFTRAIISNGGTFIEISGTISTTLPVTQQTTYQYTITTVGGTCTPTTAQGFISISPNSNMTILPGMDLGQTICNNSVGAFEPIIYNLDNALTVNVNWTPNRPLGISHTHLFRNQTSTIELGGNDANVAANNGQSYTITINSTTVTYTVDTGAPQNDNSKADILNGLRTEILSTSLPVSVNVVGSSLNITSINAKGFTLSGAGGNAPLQFGASNTSQTATNTLSIFGDPTVAGLAVNTTYAFTVSTVNNAFGCNDPALQVSSSGSVTITPEPSIALTSGNNNLIICQGETVSSAQGGVDIEWDITGYSLGASIGAGQLPNGVLSSYTEIPQITEINFGGDPTTFDDTDEYSITVNGIINTVTVSAADGLNSFNAILQRFETLIDNNVLQVNATFAAGVLRIQSNTGDATVVNVGINDVNGDGDQPVLNAPNITQTNRKFLRIFGAPTDPAGIYNYTISTFDTNCDPSTANGVIRVVETPTISVSAGSDANPSGLCNGSPMNPISFDVSTFSSYTVSWTSPFGQPPGITLIRTTSSTLSLVSDPVINIPGAIPAGGVSYTYRIYSTVNDNGCSTEASIEGIVNFTNGTATLDLDDNSSLTDFRVDADGGGFDPSVAPDHFLIESCQGSEIDDVIFISSVDITNVSLASGNLPSGLFADFTPNARAAGIGEFRIYGTPDNTAISQDLVLEGITDACVPAADIRVRIEVFQNSSIDLDPGSDDNQIVCNNAALPANISYTIEGALDATVTGLPNGLVGNFQAPNKFVISGDLNVAGLTTTTIYTYTVSTTNNPGGTLVGSCSETSITGNITVRPEESLLVNPLPDGSVTQQVCYGEDITPIVINVVGDNTHASLVDPLAFPDGMNFDFVEDADNMGGVLTISGSPSNAIVGNDPLTYSFTVTTDGAVTSPCIGDVQLIEITVVPLSDLVFAGADPAALNQIVCEGTLISDIEFRIAGGARNIVATFDPGLGFTRAANIRLNDPTDVQNSIIYGNAPDVVNTEVFNFEITTVNQCNPGNDEVSLVGTITVIPEETIEHQGASGDLVQEACINANIDPIIFDVTGQDAYAEFVDPNSVPSGIFLDFAPNQINGNGGVATILGSPDISNPPGDYTFEITTGGLNTSQCIDDTQSITITVNSLPTMVFSGADPAVMNQSVCQETPITPIEFTLGGGANDVIFSSSPAGLGFTRANNVSVDGNSVQIFGTAPAVVAETTFTYSLSTVSPNSCTPSVTLGGTITVYPPVQYNNWLGNLTVNDPLCSDDGGSIEVNPATVSGGFVAVKQQSSIELNNLFEVGDIITINIGPQTFNYTVQGVDNLTGNLSNDPAVFDRAQSKSEIITEIVGLINDINSGSTLVTAVGNSPAIGIATLIAKTSGIGFTLASSKQPLVSPGVITLATPIPNQSLTYGYYWRQTNSIGTPVSTLDISDPTTYIGTGLSLNLNSVTDSEYYLLTTVSNNCQADSPFVTITAPDPLVLSIDSICDTEIVAEGSGGTGQLTYIIYNSNGAEIGRSPATFGPYTFSDGDANNLPGGGFINIAPGFQYQIGIVDENNCSLNGNDSTVQVNTPLALEIDETRFDLTPAGCSNDDGSIVINGAAITGGSAGNTGNYLNITFQWNRIGGGYSNNSQNIYDLAPGDYVLTVTDNLCPTLTATSDIFTIIDNGTFEIINAPDNSLISNCSDGHLQVSIDPANPGSGNFSFEWTDQFGVTRGNTNRIEDLNAGIYTLVVRDTTTNCQRTYTYTITGSSGPLSMINPVAVNQANFSTTDILCNGVANGTFTVEFTGGNPPYFYSLNGAAFVADGFTTSTSSVTTGGTSSTVVSYTTQILTLDGLEGGTYSVKIKDSGLCTDDSGNVIELNLGSVTINEPDPLTIELNASTTEAINCSSGIQGSLGVNITGGTVSGTTPYSIIWELFGPGGEVLYRRTTSGSPTDPDDLTITGLDYAGDYSVTVTDAAGCSITEQITLEDGSGEEAFSVGENPIITQPGCSSNEAGSIEVELTGGVQPYDIKWYKLSVSQPNAISSTQSGTSSSTSVTSTIQFSDGNYVSMGKDGFFLIDNLEPGKYRAIITDATGCQIFSRSALIKSSSFNIVNQRIFNEEILDCSTGNIEADFSFRLTGNTLAYDIYLDGNLIYGGNNNQGSNTQSGTTSTSSSTFTNSLIRQGNVYLIRNLSEGRHFLEVRDSSAPDCSLDYAFDIESYVPITYQGQTEFDFDICDGGLEFDLFDNGGEIFGGRPRIDDDLNPLYTYRWTFRPADVNQSIKSFQNRTSFTAERGTYELIISDGTCQTDPIEFTFSGDIDVLAIEGLLADANGNPVTSIGVSCELGARDGQIDLRITGGVEPYNITWEIFDATNIVLTPPSSTSSTSTISNTSSSPWIPLDGSYPELGDLTGFTTLTDLPAGLYRYTIRAGSNCSSNVETPFNYIRDVISVDDDNTLVITDGPFVDTKLCEGLPGLILIDVYNNSDQDANFNFFYINTNGTDDTGDDGAPVALNGNTVRLDEDTFQINIEQPFEYGKLVITTDDGCGVETEFNLALGTPYFSFTSPSLQEVEEIPAREIVTFLDESDGEYSALEWNFGDNSPLEYIDLQTNPGVTQITHAYGNSGTYYPTLTIYNEIGCYESITQPIIIGRGYSIYTPNTFSPNNDCLNDYFRPLFTGFESLIFNIYDARGNLIYSEEASDGEIDYSDCPNTIDSSGNGKSILGWNGTLESGEEPSAFTPYYIYSIYAVPLYRTSDNQVVERSGIFTILK